MFDLSPCEVFIEYRPTEYIAETRATRNNLHFSCSCFKKIGFHTGYAAIENSWQTINERESDIASTSVFDCQFSTVGRLMAIKISGFFFTIFGLRSSIILTYSIAAYLV